jgi:DNA-binding MarR family transcriptional regulator
VRVTGAQATVLGLMLTLTEQRGEPPTFKELADALGHNTMTVVRHVARLERKGLVMRRDTKWRYNVVTDAGRAALGGSQ